MGKLVFVFLAVCFVSTFSTSSAHDLGHVLNLDFSHGKSLSHGKHSHSHYIHADSHDDHTEIYVALAEGAFEFFSKLVRAKVEILLLLKSAIIPLLVRGFAHLRHLMIHNSDFIHEIINIIAELMKSLLADTPHVAASHVGKIFSSAAHDLLGFGLGHGHF